MAIVGDMRSSCVVQSHAVMDKAFMRHEHNQTWCLKCNISTSAGLEMVTFPSEYSFRGLWLPFIHGTLLCLPHVGNSGTSTLRLNSNTRSESIRKTVARTEQLNSDRYLLDRRQFGESVKAKCKRRANLACAGRLSTNCMSHARVHMTCRRQKRITPSADEGAGTDAKSSC